MVIKRGTNGVDKLVGTTAFVTLLMLLAGNAVAATKIGTARNDTLNGTAGADILGGRAGNDTLNGLGGTDKVYGDTENDKLFGSDGNDQLYGGPGNDALDGGNGDDRLYGQEDRDVLRGGPGNDVLVDDSGYDFEGNLLYGAAGSDTISLGIGDAYGGDGNDTISVCSGKAFGEAGNDTITIFACDDGDIYGFLQGGGTARGGPGADKLVFDTPVCGDLHVTYTGWEPGIDQITGRLWSWDFPPDAGDAPCSEAIAVPLGTVREYMLKHFDTNRDKHISKADGPTFLANRDSLTFPVDPSTGKQSLEFRTVSGRLYLQDVTTLF